MMYKTFTRYTPKGPLSGVAYLQSEDGLDWYKLRESLVDSDVLKIAFQADGIISKIRRKPSPNAGGDIRRKARRALGQATPAYSD